MGDLHEIMQRFHELDKDGSGTLTKEDFRRKSDDSKKGPKVASSKGGIQSSGDQEEQDTSDDDLKVNDKFKNTFEKRKMMRRSLSRGEELHGSRKSVSKVVRKNNGE